MINNFSFFKRFTCSHINWVWSFWFPVFSDPSRVVPRAEPDQTCSEAPPNVGPDRVVKEQSSSGQGGRETTRQQTGGGFFHFLSSRTDCSASAPGQLKVGEPQTFIIISLLLLQLLILLLLLSCFPLACAYKQTCLCAEVAGLVRHGLNSAVFPLLCSLWCAGPGSDVTDSHFDLPGFITDDEGKAVKRIDPFSLILKKSAGVRRSSGNNFFFFFYLQLTL